MTLTTFLFFQKKRHKIKKYRFQGEHFRERENISENEYQLGPKRSLDNIRHWGGFNGTQPLYPFRYLFNYLILHGVIFSLVCKGEEGGSVDP